MLQHTPLPKLELHCDHVTPQIARLLYDWSRGSEIWGCFELQANQEVQKPPIPLEFTTKLGAFKNPNEILSRAHVIESVLQHPLPSSKYRFSWFLFLTDKESLT